ncbi:hypothetical protein GZ998_01800 [Actinomyces sp. 594]|nr:hypothetical protein [Actinomyces sp. 594]
MVWDNNILRYYFNQFSDQRSEQALAATGNHPSQSTFMALAHPYLRNHDADAFARMATFGMAGTWLGALLTGQAALDPTQASYSGIFNTLEPQRGWIQETVELLDIDPGTLPPVKHAVEILGTVTSQAAADFGLPVDIPRVGRLGRHPGGLLRPGHQAGHQALLHHGHHPCDQLLPGRAGHTRHRPAALRQPAGGVADQRGDQRRRRPGHRGAGGRLRRGRRRRRRDDPHRLRHLPRGRGHRPVLHPARHAGAGAAVVRGALRPAGGYHPRNVSRAGGPRHRRRRAAGGRLPAS